MNTEENKKVEEIEAELNLLLTEYWNTEDRSRTANVLEAVEKALTCSYEQGLRDERERILTEVIDQGWRRSRDNFGSNHHDTK